MGISIMNKIRLKIIELSFSKQNDRLVDKELFLRVTRLAMEPVGERKVPLYRTRHDKKAAFKVIEGGLVKNQKDVGSNDE